MIPCSSAAFFTRLRPITQFLIASSSEMPLRLPKNAMMFGTPAFLARGIASMRPFTIESWFFGSFRPSGMPPGLVFQTIEHMRPWSARSGQSVSSTRSMAVRPISATALQNSGMRDLPVAPAADRLLEAALLHDASPPARPRRWMPARRPRVRLLQWSRRHVESCGPSGSAPCNQHRAVRMSGYAVRAGRVNAQLLGFKARSSPHIGDSADGSRISGGHP